MENQGNSSFLMQTNAGEVKILRIGNTITSISFTNEDLNVPLDGLEIQSILFTDLYSEIEKYIVINKVNLNLLLINKTYLIGTEFQKLVWNEICKIPLGETRTYSQIAEAIGKPKSYRAVANACGQNNLAILIPCHRVTGKNNLGGYKWGIQRKKFLLDFEKLLKL